MTKHNLKQNLSWLLGTPTSFPSSYPTPSICDFSTPPTSQPITADEEVHPALALNVTESKNAGPKQADSEFLLPGLPASVLNDRERDDMARLQLAPKSNSKARLISEASTNPLRNEAPTRNHSSRSLKQNYTAQYQSPPEGTLALYFLRDFSIDS